MAQERRSQHEGGSHDRAEDTTLAKIGAALLVAAGGMLISVLGWAILRIIDNHDHSITAELRIGTLEIHEKQARDERKAYARRLRYAEQSIKHLRPADDDKENTGYN